MFKQSGKIYRKSPRKTTFFLVEQHFIGLRWRSEVTDILLISILDINSKVYHIAKLSCSIIYRFWHLARTKSGRKKNLNEIPQISKQKKVFFIYNELHKCRRSDCQQIRKLIKHAFFCLLPVTTESKGRQSDIPCTLEQMIYLPSLTISNFYFKLFWRLLVDKIIL